MSGAALRAWFHSALLPEVKKAIDTRSPAFLAGSTAVCAGALFVGSQYYNAEMDSTRPGFSVMTWNVLARPYTTYNRDFHRAAGKLEEETQTRTRYTHASSEILSQAADLVYLQECEAAFFDPAWNMAAKRLSEAYRVFPCRVGENPGTAVMVKKAGCVTALKDKPICIGGSEATGGHSKVATVLPVRAGARELTAVSTHFTWDGAATQRQHHADLIAKSLGKGTARAVVLGGDFNCEPGKALQALEASELFRGRLHRVPLPEDIMTGLSGDFSKQVCIDHIYMSSGLEVLRAIATARPRSPWGGQVTRPAKVQGASDHVPVLVEFALQ